MSIVSKPKLSLARKGINSLLAVAIAFLSFGMASPLPATAEESFFGVKYDPAVHSLKATADDEPYVKPAPMPAHDSMHYLQPWDGYCNKSDLPEDEAKRLPCQTSNVKPLPRYMGAELGGNKWMHMACDEALKSVQHGGGPFSTVIVQIDNDTNKVIRYWVSWNRVVEWVDPTAHGETTAIRQACQELGVFDLGNIRKDDPKLKLPQTCAVSHCDLYTSAEPCPMCYCATRWARINNIYFAATVYDAAAQGVGFSDQPIYVELSMDYKDRQKMGVNAFQCTEDNSLDAFNHYKRSARTKY
ncbi:MAG TPA: nucleoside deaminase [Oculatellaceae cyanobacterium]